MREEELNVGCLIDSVKASTTGSAMAPLEALELDYPLIDSNFRSFCSSRGICTVEDFLLHDQYEFEAFLERECEPDKLKQGLAQLLSVVESHHQPWLNGLELLEDAELNKGYISTGCERIDVLLQGGLRVGQVTELVGPSSSGKTQVCLKIASHVARNSGSIMYFDSGNSFSPKRIAQFLCQPTDSIHIEVEKTVQQVMSSIVCHSVFDIFTLLDMLHQLMNNLKSQALCSIKMLIIDSLSSLIAPILGGGGAQGHAIMVTAGYLLKELACGRNISVVVTNHMVAGEAGSIKPALGESWKSIPHVRLLLSRCYTTNCSYITLHKHPYLGTGKRVEFMIP